ncbi:MAG: hypothetical protein C5B47_00050 [Verrucomicrobia bacterium]|nr:MAG: hypothetical protein C5B47_00050 [Verrucomicrobiota bacterium]
MLLIPQNLCLRSSGTAAPRNRFSDFLGRLCSASGPRQTALPQGEFNSPFPNPTIRKDFNRLYESVKNDQLPEAKWLLKRLTKHHIDDVNNLRRSGLGLMHLAAKKRDSAMLGLLLKYGLNPNIRDDTRGERSPLFYAVNGGNYESTKLLLNASTNEDLILLALQEAKDNGHEDLENLLKLTLEKSNYSARAGRLSRTFAKT